MLNDPEITKGILLYEDGALDANETVRLFQKLIDTGLAWTLPGNYGRVAVRLIDQGYCSVPKQEGSAA